MSSVALRNIVDAGFRASREYELILFDRLPSEQQEAFKDLTKDPDFYGVLIPKEGSTRNTKAVSQDTALLFLTLTDPGPVPAYVRAKLGGACNQTVAELVLDGVLEIAREGRFVCGSEAYDLIYEEPPAAEPRGTLARLAQAALEYAQALDIGDSARLSARLYFYNRLPLSPRWKRRFPDQAAVAAHLGIESGGANRRLLDGRWSRMKLPAEFDGWFQWESQAVQPLEKIQGRGYKLYVSPQPEFVQEAFRAVLEILTETSAHHFKVGSDVAGLLRPDKIVIYFRDFESLQQAAKQIATRLVGCPAHGVPFTAGLGDDALLSWGIDPQPDKGALAWQERESWRLWITNRLAVALLAAKNASTNGLEPWRFALERLRLDNVDTETWAPLASFGRPSEAER
ncbi:MAG: hypothetical protein KGM47_02560 [Acidobacteriota bacterium]|nr:hypothetical protein [Acidobacteriota bacterium]